MLITLDGAAAEADRESREDEIERERRERARSRQSAQLELGRSSGSGRQRGEYRSIERDSQQQAKIERERERGKQLQRGKYLCKVDLSSFKCCTWPRAEADWTELNSLAWACLGLVCLALPGLGLASCPVTSSTAVARECC